MSIDVSQFHQVFFEESFEGLDAMEMGLLELQEGTPDVDVINTIFRAAHSIKGGAGTFGFNDVSDFTHGLETLLDEMRDGRRDVTNEAVAICLEAVDVLREMLNAVQQSAATDEERIAEVSSHIKTLLEGNETVPEESDVSDAEEDENVPPVIGNDNDEAAAAGWRIRFIPHIEMSQTGNDPLRILRELNELGDMSVSLGDERLPAFTDLVPEECYLQWDITLNGDISKEAITEIFEWVEDVCDLSIEPLQEQTEQESTEAEVMESEDHVDDELIQTTENNEEQVEIENHVVEAQQVTQTSEAEPMLKPAADESKPLTKPSVEDKAKLVKKEAKKALETQMSSIRVGTDKVDSLINLVGELVITQSMLTQMGEDFEPKQLPKLLDGLEQLARNTRELQESIMRIRMLPISFAFNRFPRLVHDLSAKMGKKVELKLTGEQTELDKTVMEKIGDPLVHLVRNSLDHGLETPDKRRAAGKSETGILHLNAYHQGGSILIEIVDDGAGLNEEKILQKAIDKGLVSESDSLTSEKIQELIFLPGFSTADVVSDVSGRGVGMDVVRRNIQSLGGNIEIKSEKGKGSKFTIRLPLTLAIMDGQIIQVADQKYIIPLLSIIESIEIDAQNVKKVSGKGEVFKLRDEYIPLIRLYEVFNLEPRTTNLEEGLLVVVENENSKVGLFVDELLSQQQIVIKSLETNYRNVTGLAGATILGDGLVALILDVTGLMTLYRRSEHKKNRIEAA